MAWTRSHVLPFGELSILYLYLCVAPFFFFSSWEEGSEGWPGEAEGGRCCPSDLELPVRCKATSRFRGNQ